MFVMVKMIVGGRGREEAEVKERKIFINRRKRH